MGQKKCLEISCSSADQNRRFCIYWSLIKASKCHYKSNSIQSKQEERLLYPVGLIFRCFFFFVYSHDMAPQLQLISAIIQVDYLSDANFPPDNPSQADNPSPSVNTANRRYTKGYLFCQKWHIKGLRGQSRLGAKPPHIKLC